MAGCLTPPQREIGGDFQLIRIAMAAGVFLDGGDLEDQFHDNSISGVMGEVIQRISTMTGG